MSKSQGNNVEKWKPFKQESAFLHKKNMWHWGRRGLMRCASASVDFHCTFVNCDLPLPVIITTSSIALTTMMWSQCPQLRQSMCKKFNHDQNSLYVISFYAKDTACHFMAFQLLCWCPEARHISGNQGGSQATTGVPMLAGDPMFTLDLGVAWNIEAWHVVWYVWRHLPGECQKVQHTLGQGCTAHTLVCSTANMVGCGTAWVFTFAKDALLCRAAHGQIDAHQLPKVVMPSAVYVGVVHVKICMLIVLKLCPVPSWMGAFPGATSPKRTMIFGSWSGPQCQKTSTTPKNNLRAIQACNWKVPEQAHAKTPGRDQGKVHLKWLISFNMESSHTFKMVPSGFMYVWYIRTFKTRTRSRSWNAVATMGKCLQLSCSRSVTIKFARFN